MPPEIKEIAERGALFVVNHSGGKDSQAMAAVLRRWIPEGQLLVVHAKTSLSWSNCVRSSTSGQPMAIVG